MPKFEITITSHIADGSLTTIVAAKDRKDAERIIDELMMQAETLEIDISHVGE